MQKMCPKVPVTRFAPWQVNVVDLFLVCNYVTNSKVRSRGVDTNYASWAKESSLAVHEDC